MVGYLFSLEVGQKWQNASKVGKIFTDHRLPRVSEFNRESEEPLQGAKMTVIDKLEFRDINGPALMD